MVGVVSDWMIGRGTVRDDVPLCRDGEGYMEKVERKLYDEGTAVDKGPGGDRNAEGTLVTQGRESNGPSVLN